MYGHSERSEAGSKLQRSRRSRRGQAFHSEEVTLKVSRRDPWVRAGLAFLLGMMELRG